MSGTVVLPIVTAHCAPRLIGQPDRVSIFICFFIFHMQKFLSFDSSVIENSATAVFLGAFLETSVNRRFGVLEKRQPSFPSTARTAGGSDRPGAAKAPGLSPAFPSSPRILCLLLGIISEPVPQHPATNGSQRPFGLWWCWELSSMAGGPQIGAQGLTRRFEL